jgi:hypothetical protein
MTALAEIRSAGAKRLAEEAIAFLESQPWCGGVVGGELAFAVSSVVGVFKLRVRPKRPGVDDVLWVVVGDVPPAYLVLDNAPDWQAALAGYIAEMGRWVAAVKSGAPLDNVIPVAAAPTAEHAAMLESRLAFLRENLVNLEASHLESDR